MIMKKFPVKAAAVILATALFAASLGGCGKKSPGYTMYSGSSKAETYDINGSDAEYTDIANYTEPVKGEEIVVMTIKDKGTVKFKLFPDLLPRACANFVGHVVNGTYDGLTFHRVISDFMIQAVTLSETDRAEKVYGEADLTAVQAVISAMLKGLLLMRTAVRQVLTEASSTSL